MGNSSFLRGVGVVVATIALMECGYRLVYWYWMSVSDPAEAAANAAHLHTWLGVTVFGGLVWVYLGWKLLMDDRAASKSKQTAKSRKTQV